MSHFVSNLALNIIDAYNSGSVLSFLFNCAHLKGPRGTGYLVMPFAKQALLQGNLAEQMQ